jgi:putative addiction module CopG family antidote
MPNVEKISVALTSEMAAFVRDVVESGEYASSSEVIREALRDWKQKRLLQLQNIDEVRCLWHSRLVLLTALPHPNPPLVKGRELDFFFPPLQGGIKGGKTLVG